MDKKRRDNKGRLLFKGEVQEKNGRYKYRYNDLNGKRKSVYSWKLTRTDITSKGDPTDKSLREKEKEIDELLKNETNDIDITVINMFARFLKLKNGIKENTFTSYKTVYNYISKHPFGNKRVRDVRQSQAKEFLIQAQIEGKSFRTINGIRKKMKLVFQMAIDDNLILKNPFNFNLSSIITNDSKKRQCLSDKDTERFLEFIKYDNTYYKYYDVFIILLNTGLRISEFCGLTIKDIDFNNKIIKVNKQLSLIQDRNTNKMKLVVMAPKSESSKREIPMTNDVVLAFKRIIDKREKPKIIKIIDGYSDFLFYTRNGEPVIAAEWQRKLRRICIKYNKKHELQLPTITPHVMRHTFCTNMAKAGIAPKTLQYIMGHSDISVTLNVYTHYGIEEAKEDLRRLSII